MNPIDIIKIKAGDHEAFKAFFGYFHPKMMALACRFVEEQVATMTWQWQTLRLGNGGLPFLWERSVVTIVI